MLLAKLRPLIVPLETLIADCMDAGLCVQTCLDVGCGTGLFLEEFYRAGIIAAGTGVEISTRYRRTINPDCRVILDSELSPDAQFELVMFNDVLHHVADKPAFLKRYLTHLCPGGWILVKEMNPERFMWRWLNRLHDLVMAHQLIRETTPENLEQLLTGFIRVRHGRRRILWYDHYWSLFRSPANLAAIP